MYDCSTIMKLVNAYLDGQLDVKESLRVESHLQECQDCRETFLAEKEFQNLVHSATAVTPAPEFTARCLQAALDREVRHRVRAQRFRRLPWMAAAIVLAATVAVFVAMNESKTRVPRVVTLAVDAHTAYLRDPATLDVTSRDGAAVSSWLSKRLPFEVTVPESGLPGFELVGGRIVADSPTPAAHLAYRTDEDAVSLLMMPPRETRLNGRDVISFRNILFHPADVSGYHTLEWSDNRNTYVLVSSSPRAVYQACLLCHQSSAGRELLSGFSSGLNGI
jgi:anti-sigma factor RsiW